MPVNARYVVAKAFPVKIEDMSFWLNAGLATVAVAILWWLPNLGVKPAAVNELTLVALYAATVIGLNTVFGFAGQITLGPALVFAVGAYTTAILSVHLRWNLWLDVVIGVVVAGIVGAIIAAPALRVGGFYLAMVTALAAQAIPTWAELTPKLSGSDVGLSVNPFSLGKKYFHLNADYRLSIVVLALCGLVASNIARSAWGRWFRALQTSEAATSAVGVSVYRAKTVSFVLSALIGGLAGGVYAGTEGVVGATQFSFDFSIVLFSALVLGGVGSLWGPVIGVAIYVLVPYYFLPMNWGPQSQAIYGGILILVMLAVPKGLASIPRQLSSSLRIRLGNGETERREHARPLKSTTEGAMSVLCERARQLAPGEVVLEARDISHHYGGVAALNSVSISVKAGEVIALIGPNGSGKTTLLNALSGFIGRGRGMIRCRGKEIQSWTPHRRALLGIARTFQRPVIFSNLGALDNIRTGLTERRPAVWSSVVRSPRHRRFEARSRIRAQQIMRVLGLGDEEAASAALSSDLATHKILDIARALALDPIVLMLDEPAAGLAADQVAVIESVISEVRNAGVGVLVIDHDVGFVSRVADTVVALDRGRVIAAGAPDDVRGDPAVVAAYFGDMALEP